MMSTTTDIVDHDEAELAAAVRGNFEQDDLILPLLKVAHGTTAEVQEGNATSGQFINSLTGETLDSPVEVVIVNYRKGRFYSPEGSSEAYVAFSDIVPDNWPAEYAGQHFADVPDAEEQYSAAANRGDIDWGSGPPIRTTYNYIGFIVNDPDLPIRISLQRTSRPAARKLNTLLQTAPAPWSHTFELSTEAKDNAKGKFYVINVRRGAKASDELRQAGVTLARQLQSVEAQYHGDDTEGSEPAGEAKPAAPEGAPEL